MKNENLTHINNRSDFQILLKTQDGKTFPDFAFSLVFQTTGGFRYYVKSDDTARFVPNEARTEAVVTFDFRDGNYFPNGRLAYTIKANIPNPMFPDGYENTQTPQLTDIEVWAGASDENADTTEAVFILPLFKGEKGADGYTPIKGVDYWTPQDVAEMDKAKQSALDSAKEADDAAERADEAAAGIADELAKKQDKITADNPIQTEQIADNAVTKSKLSDDLQAFVDKATDSYLKIRSTQGITVKVDNVDVMIPANEIVTLRPKTQFMVNDATAQYIHYLYTRHFDTSNVTDMRAMFYYCRALQTLDLSGFDTSNVTNMNTMFSNCQALQTLDLSGFDTSNVTDMNTMFSNCRALQTLKLGNGFFKTPHVSSINFSTLTKWTNATAKNSLVTNSYDRAANGLPTMTLQLSEQTKAVLTDEDKQTMTNKGYTIA